MDMQLVQYGKEVIRFREEFIGQLNEMICEIHRKLSGGKETLKIVYDPNSGAEELEAGLARSRSQDVKQKTTLIGPHRDDIGFYIGDIDIRRFGSQGQQRTAALSLKLAEIELVKKLVRDYPILLLDDVLSELDGERQNHLLSAIDHIQTMITCTGLEDFVNNRFQMDKLFHVVNGTVTGEN
ncbi:MAG: DNA replication/repair protein RecF [Clostridium sp.]